MDEATTQQRDGQPLTAAIREVARRGVTRIRECADQIGGFTPTATGYLGGSLLIIEAPSRAELYQAQASVIARWMTLLAAAHRAGGCFVAIVPRTDEAAARAFLRHVCGDVPHAQVWTF